jgi:hypothetical protein
MLMERLQAQDWTKVCNNSFPALRNPVPFVCVQSINDSICRGVLAGSSASGRRQKAVIDIDKSANSVNGPLKTLGKQSKRRQKQVSIAVLAGAAVASGLAT